MEELITYLGIVWYVVIIHGLNICLWCKRLPTPVSWIVGHIKIEEHLLKFAEEG